MDNTPTKPQRSSDSGSPGLTKRTVLKVLIAFALFNTAILVGVAVVGHKAYMKMEAKTEAFAPYTNVLSGTASPEESREVVHSLGVVMNAVVGDFLLGATNGQLSGFVSNIFQKNFASLGYDVEIWAMQLERAFENTSCNRWVMDCPPNQWYTNWTNSILTCPMDAPNAGRSVNCYYSMYGDSQVECDSQVCAAAISRKAAAYVETIARKLQQMHTLTSPDQYPAAFSNGLFQFDGIFHWLQAQTSIPAWKASGVSCLALSPKLKAIDWAGCYTDTDGGQSCWNITESLHKVVDEADQWCQGMANLPTA